MPERLMKDSGIEWIGEIPQEWATVKIKYASWLKGRIGWDGLKSTEFTEEGPYLITGTDFVDGRVDWNTCVHISKERYNEDELLHIRENDLLITKDGTVGKLAIVNDCPDEVSLNSGVLLIRNDRQFKYEVEYLYYVLLSNQFKLWYELSNNGNSTIKHLYQEQFYDFEFSYPSIEEQSRIADFLDKKVSEIDAVISKTKESIEEYKKLKQSIITEAVTKGLDPNVEVKDSGIEWAGYTPNNWGKDKILRSFKIIGSGTTPKTTDDDNFEGKINWIQSGDINGGKLKKCNNHINDDVLNRYSALKVYKAPFIVVAMYGASIGNVSISSIDGCVNQACCVLSEPYTNLEYVFYCLKSAKDYFIYKGIGGGQPNISQEEVKQLWIPVPSVNEQKQIVEYLDDQCSKYNALISKKEQIITELEQYKKSLIYEYVTGKKEVA